MNFFFFLHSLLAFKNGKLHLKTLFGGLEKKGEKPNIYNDSESQIHENICDRYPFRLK